VTEVNPVSAWLFEVWGLIPGLAVDGIVTALAVLWVGLTQRVPPVSKSVFFLVLTILTGWAVYNNYQIMIEMGLT
jgi:hypothetical protein